MATYKNNLLFDYLKNILDTKSEEIYQKHISAPEFYSSFQRFMILRYLSMHKNKAVRNAVMEYQVQLERFPESDSLYKYLMKIIPKAQSFITYIK